jgi:hypothetical protein
MARHPVAIWIAAPLVAVALGLATPQAGPRAVPGAPQGMSHDQHQKPPSKEAELKPHGDMAMGFDQDKVVHHFRLAPQGGEIEVTAKDPGDVASRDAVRRHLQQIATAFAEGDFEKPLMTHGEEPPGVPTMKRLRTLIRYKYEELPAGGRVVATTRSANALRAIHEFLRYQIAEHKTGDAIK